MNKRTKRNIQAIIILLITLVLTVLAIHTLCIGTELALLSCDVADAELKAGSHPMMRVSANSTYEAVQQQRNKLYYSSNPYTRWISTMDNVVRLPLGLFIMLSPILFIMAVRSYNLNKRRKARM